MNRKQLTKLTFKTFLSHRYQATEVNTYFYNIFDESAEVQFEVDQGRLSTSVTRLERMIRDADAFVGIYSLSEELGQHPSQEELLKSSQYFRLELELALRSKKPGIVFVDKRYGSCINIPTSFTECRYDASEIGGSGGSPTRKLFQIEFVRFCELVNASINFNIFLKSKINFSNKVAFILPNNINDNTYYTPQIIENLRIKVAKTSKLPVLLDWPPILNEEFIKTIEESDYVVVDINDPSGVVEFLHGLFKPMLRLFKSPDHKLLENTMIYKTFFSNQTVGYIKDIVKWDDEVKLLEQFDKRLYSINYNVERFNTINEAVKYFKRAALRKETVFLSYSGDDIKTVNGLIGSINDRFQETFNYKDAEKSIKPGTIWIEQVFDSLAKSALGIIFLSDSYLSSGNCMHEARQMFALRDAGKIQVLCIKLYPEKLKNGPSFIEDSQYLRYWNYDDNKVVVLKIEEFLDSKRVS